MKRNHSILINSLLLAVISFAFWTCKDDANDITNRNWQLVWADDFNGLAGQSPDAANWAYDIGTGNNGWGNQELQYYTDRPENIAMDGLGNLAITARSESFGGSGFTSARIKTQGLFDRAYGRFEARIKLPWGPGIWPAFWMLGSNIDDAPWPQCGEIDIMEYRGQQPNLVHGSVHGPGYSGGAAITKSFGFTDNRFDVDFHVFAVEWGADYIDYYVDDTLYQRITPDDTPGEWVYDHPFFIILNVAVGGNFVGFPTSQTPFPQTMLVDYVKVYKEAN
ncbi:MAG: glycoside hydrolase family 16 protein [Lewinellaceae bacterium]|jgi:beta-glucanase (GH16 family)|nr:glycoside hydrolase family 16 protein [Lewinellaceae bacterium]